jgi:DNA-binding transcriptional MerR regulator
MLTIGQLASYTGVTIRAVRHYHRIGLLPEPPRNRSGYREYDSTAVVTLIRIRTLADAGVPLARVQQLLDADPIQFTAEVARIDAKLRADIRRLQHHRTTIAKLAAGDSLALPATVTDYLARLRQLGVDERILEMERDAWIMIAAQIPDGIDEVMRQKNAELDDPDMVELYLMLTKAADWAADDPRIADIAVLERLLERSLANGTTDDDDELDDQLVDLLDATTLASSPIAATLLTILEQRGWKGWTRVGRIENPRAPAEEKP